MGNEKTCKECSKTKPIYLFKKHSGCKGGYRPVCQECTNVKQREYRNRNSDKHTKKYEKTKTGYLMRTYRNMLSRTNGVLKHKQHLYSGKFLLGKEDFYDWSLNNQDFHNLFDEWERQGYPTRLSPSIDRRDSSEGYTISNMRWITHSENSKRGAYSRYGKECDF